MTPKKVNGLIVILVFSLIAVSLFSYQNILELKRVKSNHSELKDVFDTEKEELQKELDRVIFDYNDAISRKSTVSGKLRKELVKIRVLKESLENLKIPNYNLIRKYRERINDLEERNKYLFVKVDSLQSVNSNLLSENIIVKKQKDSINLSLKQANKSIYRSKQTLKKMHYTIAKASVLKAKITGIQGMKERSSGKLTSTTRARRTDVINVTFDILENAVAKEGKKNVYVEIINPSKKVVSPKGSLKLKDDNITVSYSDKIEVNYENKTVKVISLVKTDDRLEKGTYTVNIYLNSSICTTNTFFLR